MHNDCVCVFLCSYIYIIQIMPSISNNFYIKLPAKGEKYDECRMVSTYTSINAKYVTKTEKRYYF